MVEILAYVWNSKWVLLTAFILFGLLATMGAVSKSQEDRPTHCITIEAPGLGLGSGNKPVYASRILYISKNMTGKDIHFIEEGTGFYISRRVMGDVAICTPPGMIKDPDVLKALQELQAEE